MAHFTDLIYTHQKTGGHYRIIHFGIRESDMTPVVVYKTLIGNTVWVRPCSEFFDGRFVTGGAEPKARETEVNLENADPEAASTKTLTIRGSGGPK